MVKLKIYSKPNCMACKMTSNITQSMHIPHSLTVIHPESPKDSKLIDQLKNKYHVRQMPFVQAVKDGHIIDSWTGFQPDKIKQYRKEA